jgi:cell division protein FtsI (penicillin-binding protein 3)
MITAITASLLAEWLLKGAVVSATAALGVTVLRRAPAAVRRGVLVAGVGGPAALPLMPTMLPVWSPAEPPPVAAPAAETAVRTIPRAGTRVDGVGPEEAALVSAPSAAGPFEIFSTVWALGSALLLVRLIRDHRRAAAVRGSAIVDATGQRTSTAIDTPMVLGVLRPVIVLPAGPALSPAARPAALAHERAHLAAHDTRVLCLADVLCALRWFDPLSWWTARRLRLECELAADDVVLASGTRPADYAELLLGMTRSATGPRVALGVSGGDAGFRIARVLEGRGRRLARGSVWAAAGSGLLFAAAVGCAGPEMAPTAEPSFAPPAESGFALPLVGGDEVVQAKVDEALHELVADEAPLAVGVVVVEVESGRVLALSGRGPRGDAEALDALEPASTVKPLVAAAALEAGLSREVRLDTRGQVELDGRVLTDAHPAETLTVEDVLVRSSNVGAVRIAEAVGAARVREVLVRFGLVAPDAPAWSPVQAGLATAGAGLSTTPVQIARAFATLGNGGLDPVRGERVVSRETAHALLGMLEAVVERGTGQGALTEALRTAGKTGTLTLRGPDGDPWTRASFVGLAPVETPRWAVYVRVDTRAQGASGGTVAAPLFRRIVEALARDC